MENLARFDYIMKLIGKLASIAGANILKPNYKPNFLIGLSYIVVSLYYIVLLYALYWYRNDELMLIRVISIFPFGIQGVIKLQTGIAYRWQFRCLVEFLRSIFIENLHASSKRKQIFSENISKCYFFLKVGRSFIAISLLGLILSTALNLLFMKKMESILDVVIPATDPATITGLLINWIFQFIVIIYFFCGSIAFDLSFVFIVLHIPLLTSLLRDSLEDIEQMLRIDRKYDHDLLRTRLCNCLRMHQNIINYISCVDSTFVYNIWGQIVLPMVPLALILFSISMTSWISGYFLALFFFCQIFIYCIIGTVLETVNDDITDIFYSFKWYLCPIDCQKLILIALMKSQNAATLNIAKVAPLNVETGARVTKMIYSYLMMLLTFVE